MQNAYLGGAYLGVTVTTQDGGIPLPSEKDQRSTYLVVAQTFYQRFERIGHGLAGIWVDHEDGANGAFDLV